MNKLLINTPITRRYLNQLITDCDAHEYHFNDKSYAVTQMTTFLESEKPLIERYTYDETVKFWKELEKRGAVKMLSYIDYLNENGLELDNHIDKHIFTNPYEEVMVEKEIRVRPLDKKKLDKIYAQFASETDTDASLTSGLAHHTSKYALRFTKTSHFEYGGEKLKFKKDTRPYLVLASILKRSNREEDLISYEQIEADVPSILTEKQMTYRSNKRNAARNKNISNTVGQIQKEIERLVDKAYARNEVRAMGRVALSTERGVGVKITNPKIR